jgi:hypothetical protein
MKSIDGFEKFKNMAGRTRVAIWRMNVKINVIQHPRKKGLLHIGWSHGPALSRCETQPLAIATKEKPGFGSTVSCP